MAARKFQPFRFDQLDANENVFFERELEHVLVESYDVLYPDLMARSLMPTGSFGADTADELFTWRQFDFVGQADLIANYGDDVNMVNTKGLEFQTKIYSYGDGCEYNVQELQAGAKVGRPIDRDRVKAARKAFEQRIEKVGALGDSRVGLYGLLNQPNTVIYSVPNGATSGTKAWATKTPDEIANDVNGMALAIITATNNVEKPDTLVLPSYQYGLCASRRLTEYNSDTVLDFIKAKSEWIKDIVPWDYAKGIGSGVTDRMAAYKKSPEKLKFVVTREYTMEPPQPHNLTFKVPGYGRTCGVLVHYPKSICYGDGI